MTAKGHQLVNRIPKIGASDGLVSTVCIFPLQPPLLGELGRFSGEGFSPQAIFKVFEVGLQPASPTLLPLMSAAPRTGTVHPHPGA